MTEITELTGCSYRREWDYRSHRSSVTIRLYFQFSVQFIHALAHSGQADAGFCACFTKSIQTLRWYAASIIFYFQSYLLKLLLEADRYVGSSGVAMYVRQAFLQDAEEGNL
ncbi:MAG: hypothetical protein WBW38_14345 [Candidatus Sulfotelmatobacter sp.]